MIHFWFEYNWLVLSGSCKKVISGKKTFYFKLKILWVRQTMF